GCYRDWSSDVCSSDLLLSWTVAVALVGGLLALAYTGHGLMRDRRRPEAGGENAQESKRAGNGVIKLGAELAESLGLREEAAQKVDRKSTRLNSSHGSI